MAHTWEYTWFEMEYLKRFSLKYTHTQIAFAPWFLAASCVEE